MGHGKYNQKSILVRQSNFRHIKIIGFADLLVNWTLDCVVREAVGVEAVDRHGLLLCGRVKIAKGWRPDSQGVCWFHAGHRLVRRHSRSPPAQKGQRLAPSGFASVF
jgi:hypothetical protein